MKSAMMFLAFSLFMVLSQAGLGANPESDIDGTVTAKRSGELKATYTASGKSVPKRGDKVDFIYTLQGIEIDAGRGEVSEAGEDFVWIRVLSGRPDLKQVARIHATGQASAALVAKRQPPPPPEPLADDTGWGASGSYQQVDPAQRYLSAISAAHQACDYHRAFRIAGQAMREFPDNHWLQQNYPTLKSLSVRAENYRQALAAAYESLERNDIEGGIEKMKLAMQNASVACGQDQQVRSLLEQARQIAQMERDAAIEAARRRGLENAHGSESYRSEIAKKRAEREAFGNALTGNLLGLLGLVSSDEDTSYPPSEPGSDGGWVSNQVRQSEQNNSEMLNRWRESQGWVTHPPASQQTSTVPATGQESTPPSDTDWVGDQVRQTNQNNSGILQKWRQNEGWE